VDDEQDILDILHEHFAKECDVETAADGMTGPEIRPRRRRAQPVRIGEAGL
jgi:hypothetical protein